MNNIISGSDNKFDVLISYKMFYSKNHISYTYYVNIDDVINDAKKSANSIRDFMKRKNMVFIYGVAYRNRNRLCEMFDSEIKVDKYGKAFKKHLSWPKNLSNDKQKLIRNYKFCLAIENTINQVAWGKMHSDIIDNDYVTEKLWDCLKGGAIPIYFGAKNIRDFYPTNMSIISFNDFNTYNEVIYYVKSIINNSRILSKYINWPFTYSKKWYKRMKYFSISTCKLCKYISQ